MNCIECTQQEFEQVINSLEEDSYTIGHDVGRTHEEPRTTWSVANLSP